VTNPPFEFAERARTHRLVIILVITVVVELGLFLVAHFGPAFQNLVRPVYVIVLVVAAFTVWRALRRRPGTDRRRGDRRAKP
jgi:hypothetical protein